MILILLSLCITSIGGLYSSFTALKQGTKDTCQVHFRSLVFKVNWLLSHNLSLSLDIMPVALAMRLSITLSIDRLQVMAKHT